MNLIKEVLKEMNNKRGFFYIKNLFRHILVYEVCILLDHIGIRVLRGQTSVILTWILEEDKILVISAQVYQREKTQIISARVFLKDKISIHLGTGILKR